MSLTSKIGHYVSCLKSFAREPRVFLSAGVCAASACPKGYKQHYLIHTMAKVGSKTIVRTIQKSSPTAYLQITHSLANQSVCLAEKSVEALPVKPWKQLDKSRTIQRWITGNELPIKWNVMSPVRDPVARDVSYFFECLPMFYPELVASENVNQLLEKFYEVIEAIDENPASSMMSYVSHPTTWFDDEIKPLFSIDVFDQPFDFDRGFSVYHSPNANLVVPRLEDFDRCLESALCALLNRQKVEILNTNRAADKFERAPFYRLYKEFQSKVAPSQQYLDSVYNSKFSKHFFSSSELEKLQAKWSR